ncbi:MAG: hypothetical protein HRF40_04445, partial [Nitrososphaera sp.]
MKTVLYFKKVNSYSIIISIMEMKKRLEAKVRKIGTSYGVIIPKKELDSLKAKEGDTLIIDIRPAKPIRDMLGAFPTMKR